MNTISNVSVCQQNTQIETQCLILSPEKTAQIERIIDGIGKIESAVESLNDLLAEAGYPAKPFALKQAGCKLLFSGAGLAISNLRYRLYESRAAELALDIHQIAGVSK